MQRKRADSDSNLYKYYDTEDEYIEKTRIKPGDDNDYIPKPITRCSYTRMDDDEPCGKFIADGRFCNECIEYKSMFDYTFRQNNAYYFIYTIFTMVMCMSILDYSRKIIVQHHYDPENILLVWLLLFIYVMWYADEIFTYIMTFLSGLPFEKVKKLFYYGFK